MSTAAPDRTLPHNLEAEKSVLGAVLIDNEAFHTAIGVIDANAFYRDAHRRIFDHMVALSEKREPIDFVTLREALARAGELEDVGGPAYLAALVDGVPRATNVEYYAKIVKEKATLRNLIHSANKILTNAYEADQEADLILDEAESAIFAVAEDRAKSGFVPMKQLVQESFPKIEKLFEHSSPITGVGCHLPDLDRMTRGFQPGDLVIVAARPSMGKTSLVLNICQHVATHTAPQGGRQGVAGVFSLEMSKEQLFMRMLSSEAKIDSYRLMSGQIGQREYTQITHAMETLSEAQLFIDDTAGIGVLEMRAKARRLQAEHGLDILAIDYVQLMTGRGRFENRTLELAAISRSLKGLAKELGIPILVLSQLSRAPEARSDKRPQLSDLRECVTGDTLVVLADGQRVPIRELVGTAPEVWALSDTGRLVVARAEKVWSVGRKPVRRVRLASGRTLRATAEHRILAGSGWVTIGALQVDDRVALARRVPSPAVPAAWPDLRVALLGHLIGDGSYLTHQPLRYTTVSEENSALVARAAVAEFGARVTRHEGPTATWHQLVIAGNGNRWHPAGVNAWLRELGIFGQRSHQKRVPGEVFRLGERQIALLLKHLWATDGCIAPRKTSRGGHAVYYATTSEGLATDVAALLLRLGIVARMTTSTKVGYRPSFHVRVSGADAQREFLRVVGAFGPRVGPADALAAALADVQPNTNVDTLPAGTFARVRARMRSTGVSQRAMAAMRGTSYGGAAHFAFAPSRAILLEYAEHLDDDALRDLATSDVFWDRVVAIEDAGVEEVFDLTVPGPACWLADGVVSHNSGALEQDADLVIMIFREEMYKHDKTQPSDVDGIAELIIAKQRNGPTGTVKAAFISGQTKFMPLAGGHGGGGGGE
jgi:replicative DNA helicase